MLKKLQVVAVLMCMSSYSVAGTVSIGTASARGDMRVDNYAVKGNATLFNGSVVETGQATVDLRLEKGTEITMATGSLGTLYSDRLVLQRGKTEFASNAFKLQARGLRVTPAEPNSRGVVSMEQGNKVEVAALTGSFSVTNELGVPLASVHSGMGMSFDVQAANDNGQCTSQKSFSARGIVSCEDHHYYIATDMDPRTGAEIRYELTGKDFKSYVGKKIEVTGTLRCGAVGAGGALGAVTVSSAAIVGGAAGVGTTAMVIGGVAVAAGAGLGVGLYEVNKSTTPASR